MIIHDYTRVYMIIHEHTWLYVIIHDCSRVCMNNNNNNNDNIYLKSSIQISSIHYNPLMALLYLAKLYVGVPLTTNLSIYMIIYMIIHGYTWVHVIIHDYT